MSSMLEKPIIIEMSGRGPKGTPGDVYFPRLYIDLETGHMMIVAYTGHYDPGFEINYDTGHLEVTLP